MFFLNRKAYGGVRGAKVDVKGVPPGRTKGRPDQIRSYLLDYKRSRDKGVTCNIKEGLKCYNRDQGTKRRCRDYAIRLQCSCG